MKKLRIGILGVSNHFIKRIIIPLTNSTNCTPFAIASRTTDNAAQAAKEFNIPVIHNNYQAILDDPNVDAVYIPLPNHIHAEWVIKSLKAGKPVLCEKPLAMNLHEAETMIKESEKTRVPLMEAFMFRFHPTWIHVRDLVRTNQLGKINYIHTSFSYNNPSPSNIRNIAAYGGGSLMDIGCYAISAPRFILNREPLRVMSLISTHPEFKTDMQTSGLLDFGESRATFHVSTTAEPFQKVDIIGTSGSVTIPIPFNTYVDTPSSIIVNTGMGSREIIFPVSNPYQLMFEEFASSVIENKSVPLPLSDAINNMKIIDAIRKSSEYNNWVDL